MAIEIYASGRLSYGCTNLATAYPHGGVELGMVGGLYVSPQRLWEALPQEETNSAAEVLWLGGDVVLGGTSRDWLPAALGVIFPNTVVATGDRIIEWPGSLPAGSPAPTVTNLVFTPRNQAEHMGVIIYKACILPDVNMELRLSAYNYIEVPFVVIAQENGSGALGKMGRFARLSL